MKKAAAKQWSGILCAWMMCLFSAASQTNIAPTASISPLDSLFAQLIQQGASDALVLVDAEFDPPEIPLGHTAIYRVVVTAQQEACVMPEKLPAPSALEFSPSGEGMSYAAANQSIQYRTTFNYRVTANQTGAFAMPSYTLKANGKPVAVPVKSITVTAPGSPPLVTPALLRGELPAGDIYIGQSVFLRLVIPDLGNQGLMAITQSKATGDAFIFEKVAGRQRREIQSYQGKQVPVLIDEILAIPVKEGRHRVTLHAFVMGARKPDPRMISLPSYYPLLDSDPLEIVVKHLPSTGVLPGFTGLIGSFQVDPPALSTNRVRAGDPMMIAVTVRGEGNLPRLVPPKPDPIPGWQIFPPIPDASSSTIIHLRGTNIFTYALIPLEEKIQATPAIPFSYFHPQKGVYVDLTIPSTPIQVLPPAHQMARAGQDTASEVTPAISLKNPPALLNSKPSSPSQNPSHRSERVVPTQERAWFLALQVFLGGTLFGLWGWDRRRRFLALHPDIVRKRRARRGLRRELKQLRRAVARQDASAFVRASVNALREGCAPHAAAQPEALVSTDILNELAPEDREGETGRMVRKLFSLADAVTFRNKAPEISVLMSFRPQLEQLLETMRRRL